VPIPNLQRLYFKVCAPVDTAGLGLNVRRDAEGWQELYGGIKATGEREMRWCPVDEVVCFLWILSKLWRKHLWWRSNAP
jgi:hypothetical protein